MRVWGYALFVAILAVGYSGASAQPRSLPFPAPIAEPRDVAYPGVIELEVDAADVVRGIFRVRERIPVAAAGPLTRTRSSQRPSGAPRGRCYTRNSRSSSRNRAS